MRPAMSVIRHDEQILRSRNPETKTRTNDYEYGVARSRHPFLTFLVFERSRPVLHFLKSCPVYIRVTWLAASLSPHPIKTQTKRQHKNTKGGPRNRNGGPSFVRACLSPPRPLVPPHTRHAQHKDLRRRLRRPPPPIHSTSSRQRWQTTW